METNNVFDYTTLGLHYLLPSLSIYYVKHIFKTNTLILKKHINQTDYTKYLYNKPYEFKFIKDGTIIKHRLILLYQDLFSQLDIQTIDEIVNPLVEQIYKFVCLCNTVRKFNDWKAKQEIDLPSYLIPKQRWSKIHFI